VTKGRLQTGSSRPDRALTIRTSHLIDAIRGQYAGPPLVPPAAPVAPRPGSKSL